MKLKLTQNGCISELQPTGVEWPVLFRDDDFSGPCWTCGDSRVSLSPSESDPFAFTGSHQDLSFGLRYVVAAGQLTIHASIRNTSAEKRTDIQAGIRLGIDTYMEKYPDWQERLFPTLLRCERTHFWGYLMGPVGQILMVATMDPVASYKIHYKPGLHRIYTAELTVMTPLPVPSRHPDGLHHLAPGEEKTWTIVMKPLSSLDALKPAVASATDAPVMDADLYTITEGETFTGRIFSGTSGLKELKVQRPDGATETLPFTVTENNEASFSYKPAQTHGLFRLIALSGNGRQSEASLAVRRPWAWYLKQARRNAVVQAQKASTHTESWYGLFSGYLGRKHFPNTGLDAQIDGKFQEIVPLMYDMADMRPKVQPKRIQNHALMAALLVDRYTVTKDIRDLENAAALADLLAGTQTPDGAYRSGKTHYTSVVYIAKSIMEVMLEERKLAETSREWDARFTRHYESVKRAIDELALNLDNINTEGELTYEDGMISCSASQLAMFALYFALPEERQKYLEAALYLTRGHRCLSQILIPDCRMNGGSLRFWESQYDILTTPNMMNSPHGWSAWRIYGLWYLYQLTGDEDYLRQTFNALGACCQLIDFDSGELRWAFIPDPCIEASVWKEDPAAPGKGCHVKEVIGEQYMPMISQWYKAPPHTCVTGYWGKQDGGCCDNDVHEIFKCLEETVLTSAYVVERADRTIAGYNCKVTQADGKLRICFDEPTIDNIHFNLKSQRLFFVDSRKPHIIEAGPGTNPWRKLKS